MRLSIFYFRYREDCQRIFEVQNTVLASDEILSSDEAETSEESDVDEEDLDETYFIDFWIEYAEKKKKLKKQSSKSGVNNNSLSLFELKDLSKARESQNSDILSMLEDF